MHHIVRASAAARHHAGAGTVAGVPLLVRGRKNLAVVERIRERAQHMGVSSAQLALAWVLAQGRDVVPIPGTKRRRHLVESVAAASVELTDEDLESIEALAPKGVASGLRYPEQQMARVNV